MNLYEKMEADVRQEINVLYRDAKLQAEKILSSAHKNADKTVSDNTLKTDHEYERLLTIAESEARISSRTEIGQTFELLIEKLRENIFAVLTEHWNDNYSSIASDSLIRGAEEIGAQEIDVALTLSCKELFARYESEIRTVLKAKDIILRNVSFDLRGRGGMLITRSDGRRMKTETFEENFRRIEDDIRIECAQRIGYGQ
jgi:vacuolar-type H+-ATPase subunit E/Vma4